MAMMNSVSTSQDFDVILVRCGTAQQLLLLPESCDQMRDRDIYNKYFIIKYL
jgi:hypothetical protein